MHSFATFENGVFQVTQTIFPGPIPLEQRISYDDFAFQHGYSKIEVGETTYRLYQKSILGSDRYLLVLAYDEDNYWVKIEAPAQAQAFFWSYLYCTTAWIDFRERKRICEEIIETRRLLAKLSWVKDIIDLDVPRQKPLYIRQAEIIVSEYLT
ncbi:MAG: hypothetical protein ABI456_01835 [Ktedonobacteraceae bacterium]